MNNKAVVRVVSELRDAIGGNEVQRNEGRTATAAARAGAAGAGERDADGAPVHLAASGGIAGSLGGGDVAEGDEAVAPAGRGSGKITSECERDPRWKHVHSGNLGNNLLAAAGIAIRDLQSTDEAHRKSRFGDVRTVKLVLAQLR